MSPRLVHVTTVPESLGFIRGQVGYMKSLGWDVHAISSPGSKLQDFGAEEGISVHAVEMPRRITPAHDLAAVGALTAKLLRLRPTIVHAHTPKGGLLGMMASVAARTPVRIYHMRGLPLSTASGARRQLLTVTERASCAMAHHVLCQSHTLRAQALQLHLSAPSKIEVLGRGSNGVDALGRFHPAHLAGVRERVRAELGWTDAHVVIGFVGRLVRDKGIVELTAAWRKLRRQIPAARLLLVGPFEEGDAVPAEIRTELERDAAVHLVGYAAHTERWYAAMDVFTLPSHREGFPNAPLEAAAMSLPVVATDVPGCVDAVEDGTTGILVPAGDARALGDALLAYVHDAQLRKKHGAAGRARVLREFRREAIWADLAGTYQRMCAQRGISAPPPSPDFGA